MPKVTAPPNPHNAENAPRRVGVELEFIGLSAKEAATLIAETLGGTLQKQDAHKNNKPYAAPTAVI